MSLCTCKHRKSNKIIFKNTCKSKMPLQCVHAHTLNLSHLSTNESVCTVVAQVFYKLIIIQYMQCTLYDFVFGTKMNVLHNLFADLHRIV